MTTIQTLPIQQALSRGNIIAYPTETVFALGCDAHNTRAVISLKKLKERHSTQGFILLVHTIDQARYYVDHSEWGLLGKLVQSRHITWTFRASTTCPHEVQENNRIALRCSAHPLCQQILKDYPHAIVSTSANHRGHPPHKEPQHILDNFPSIVLCLRGKCGNAQPSCIYHATTDTRIR